VNAFVHKSYLSLALLLIALCCISVAQQQESPPSSKPSAAELTKKANEWFARGRVTRGQSSAELRRRAFDSKLRLRAQRMANAQAAPQVSLSSGSWILLGPAPLASDASGTGLQDYGFVSGRATAVMIDPADPSGNTVYMGGAQSGVWKSTNAANSDPAGVFWTPLTDNQATLSIGALAIQPGNSDPSKSLILAGTGEANNSSDSYFGLGMLRSIDAGSTWSLISTANGGALSFAGLGMARLAFSSASGQTSTVVAAAATTSEGVIEGASASGTKRGLYTSLDAGQTWTYNVLSDLGGVTDATSATSVVFNAGAGQFFAAIRYHGFYSSRDGITWTRLAVQPGGSMLSTTACPPQSTANNYGCPIYRGEIAVVPGRSEMYVWYVSVSANGGVVDGGIWESVNGGASWTSVSDTGMTNCGDVEGCGVQQGTYDLSLLAIPNVADTDLYAGAVNLYKCTLKPSNPGCTVQPFINLTHAYGCNPIGAPAHVHPAQHAIASVVPSAGSDSGNVLLYLANDGGVYRALDGVYGLNTGACSGTNRFDDLNLNLGSTSQFVGFSQHPTDANIVLGGAQGNGSPASSEATTNANWKNVLGGDGSFTAIDLSAPSNWYASNPDVPPGGLGIQLCTGGINCTNSGFDFVVTSSDLGGDDGGFHVPYALDPYSSSAMLVGTCRVWRGPRTGGLFTVLSPNFDTLGSGTCSGDEVNQVRALATAGLRDTNGSSVIYAVTNGLGPVDGPLHATPGGRVWISRDASAGVPAFADATNNGPQGNINPSQYPISAVALDSSDATGNTAYITVMGYTGGTGHVWKTTNAGVTWTDFTANLPDAPVSAIAVYPPMSQVYVGTDIGVFGSSTATPSWTELGPVPASNAPGFLPNVSVTGLGVFASGGQQLLRASTYGRGIWQFNLVITPDFQVAVANPSLTAFAGQFATFAGTVTALNGYASSVAISCVPDVTNPPSTCAATPATMTPASKTPFSLTAGGSAGDYNFDLQVAGSDTKHVAHSIPLTLHLIDFGLTAPSPAAVNAGRGSTSAPVSFQVTAAGAFNQSVTVSCSTTLANATCNLSPSETVTPTSATPVNMTASVSVPATAPAGAYSVTIQATTAGAPSPLTASFTLNVTSNPDFALTEPAAFPEINTGSSGTTSPISITSQDGFASSVSLSCQSSYGAGTCSISPSSVSSFPATATLTINGTSLSAGTYSLTITGTSGSTVHSLAVAFTVGDYSIAGTQSLSLAPGAQVTTDLKLTSLYSYAGKINASCDGSALAGTICSLSPANPITIAANGEVSIAATISVPKSAVPGTYNLKINTQDTTGFPAHPATIAITLAQDFLVTSSTPSQTVTAGQTSGPYNLRVQPVGSTFDSPVTLACTSGLPAGAKCNFSPAGAVTPASAGVDVVMSISTATSKARSGSQPGQRSTFLALWLFLPAIVIGCAKASNQRGRHATLVLSLFFITSLLLLSSCGGVSTGAGGTGVSPGDPVTSRVTITGTSPGTPADAGQSTVVTLVVN
jgi:hypothetical protein